MYIYTIKIMQLKIMISDAMLYVINEHAATEVCKYSMGV